MGNVVQLKQVATEASDNSIVQCQIAAYRLALAKNQPGISAAKSQIENDLKVIDAAMRSTDSPHIREQFSDIATQVHLLMVKLHEAKNQLLALGRSVGV
jgi:hypothetical protein